MSMDSGGRPDRPVNKMGMRMREEGDCFSALKLCSFMRGLNQGYEKPYYDDGDKGRYVQTAQVGQHAANGYEHRICDGAYYSDERVIWVGIHPGDDRSRNDDVAVDFEQGY